VSTIYRKPLKLTALHHFHLGQGAAMAEVDGWQLPTRYSSAEEEVEMVRRSAGICDISPTGKLDIQGDDVAAALARALPQAPRIEVGRVHYAQIAGADGSIVDQVRVAGLAHDEALALTSPGKVSSVASYLEGSLSGCAHVVDVTSGRAGFCVAGPLAHQLLVRLVDLDLDPKVFTDGSCAQARVADVHGLLVRRDMGTLPAYELYVTRDLAMYVWDALLHEGRHEGVKAFGTEALNLLKAKVSS
jgi:heterotetrameric sarcosine oxidase gamma subunit